MVCPVSDKPPRKTVASMQSSRSLNERVQHIVHRFFLFYSIYAGMNSYFYDTSTGTYRQTRFTRSAAMVANVATVLLLPWIHWTNVQRAVLFEERFYNHPLMTACENFYITVRSLLVLYIVLRRSAYEKASHVIVAEFLKIEADYLDALPTNSAIEGDFNRLFYAKSVCIVMLCLAEVVQQVFFTDNLNWYMWLSIVITVDAINMIYFASFNYFLFMVHICRAFARLNEKLRLILHQRAALAVDGAVQLTTRTSAGVAAGDRLQVRCADLQRLGDIHLRCLQMVEQHNHIYRFQMLGLRFASLTTHVLTAYNGCFYAINLHSTPLMVGFTCCLYMTMSVDQYLNDLVCDKAVRCYNETAHILKVCNAVTICSKRLRNLCEAFALRLASYKLQLSQCGLYVVDMRLWLQMIAAVVSYTVFLVQYHVVLTISGEQSIRNPVKT